jgi:hypothetical protein
VYYRWVSTQKRVRSLIGLNTRKVTIMEKACPPREGVYRSFRLKSELNHAWAQHKPHERNYLVREIRHARASLDLYVSTYEYWPSALKESSDHQSRFLMKTIKCVTDVYRRDPHVARALSDNFAALWTILRHNTHTQYTATHQPGIRGTLGLREMSQGDPREIVIEKINIVFWTCWPKYTDPQKNIIIYSKEHWKLLLDYYIYNLLITLTYREL